MAEKHKAAAEANKPGRCDEPGILILNADGICPATIYCPDRAKPLLKALQKYWQPVILGLNECDVPVSTDAGKTSAREFAVSQIEQILNDAHEVISAKPGKFSDEVRIDAETAIFYATETQRAIESGMDGLVVAGCAMTAAILWERMSIRLKYEPQVIQVNTTTRKRCQGQQQGRAHGTAHCPHPPEIRAAAVRRFNELHKAKPNRKLGLITKQVCEEYQQYQVKPRTLDDWRKNLKK
jgi:hypothetical protein